jgi:hypothetical protein
MLHSCDSVLISFSDWKIWLITGFVTRLIRRVSLVEQERLTLPEHLSSPPVFSGVRVSRSLVLYVCFVDHCLFFCTFSFGHCVCSSSIYGFWLPLGTFQLFLLVYVQQLFTYISNVDEILIICRILEGKYETFDGEILWKLHF